MVDSGVMDATTTAPSPDPAPPPATPAAAPAADTHARALGPAVAAVCAIGLVGAQVVPRWQDTYLGPAASLFAGGLLLALAALALRAGRRPAAAWLLQLVATWAAAYGLLELVHGLLPTTLDPQLAGPVYERTIKNGVNYILDRAFQYPFIALYALAVLGQCGPGFTTWWRWGDLARETTVLGAENPMPWGRVLLRLGVVMALATAALLFTDLRQREGFALGPAETFLALALLVGSFNNALVEELLYRGVLQPALLRRFGAGAANHLQAILFSLLHLSFTYIEPMDVAKDLGFFVIYYAIGLFLGRAARESDGLAAPTALHFFITAAIRARQVLPPPG